MHEVLNLRARSELFRCGLFGARSFRLEKDKVSPFKEPALPSFFHSLLEKGSISISSSSFARVARSSKLLLPIVIENRFDCENCCEDAIVAASADDRWGCRRCLWWCLCSILFSHDQHSLTVLEFSMPRVRAAIPQASE